MIFNTHFQSMDQIVHAVGMALWKAPKFFWEITFSAVCTSVSTTVQVQSNPGCYKPQFSGTEIPQLGYFILPLRWHQQPAYRSV